MPDWQRYLWNLKLDPHDERKRLFSFAWNMFNSHNFFIVFEAKNVKVTLERNHKGKQSVFKNEYLIHAWSDKTF